MKLSTALYLSVALINACNGNAKRSLEADVHSCACEALEFAFEINCEDTATVSSVTRRQSPRVLCFYPSFYWCPHSRNSDPLTCSIFTFTRLPRCWSPWLSSSPTTALLFAPRTKHQNVSGNTSSSKATMIIVLKRDSPKSLRTTSTTSILHALHVPSIARPPMVRRTAR